MELRKWRERIAHAEAKLPVDFDNNGWVVSAFCAALSAVFMGIDSFEEGINYAVKCGWDTDTVGAIAGSLLGAIHGLDAIPKVWVEPLHGWPSLDTYRLSRLVKETENSGISEQTVAGKGHNRKDWEEK